MPMRSFLIGALLAAIIAILLLWPLAGYLFG